MGGRNTPTVEEQMLQPGSYGMAVKLKQCQLWASVVEQLQHRAPDKQPMCMQIAIGK